MQMLRYLLAAAGDYSDSADDGDEAAPLKKRAAAAGSMEMGSLQADTWCSSSVSRCCALYYPKLAMHGRHNSFYCLRWPQGLFVLAAPLSSSPLHEFSDDCGQYSFASYDPCFVFCPQGRQVMCAAALQVVAL